MTQHNEIKIFGEPQVRSVWDDTADEWYFAVVDVVAALTDSVNPTDYIKKMRQRDSELAKGWGQIVTPLAIPTAGGKQKVNCATAKGLFRIIQSIPRPPPPIAAAQSQRQRITLPRSEFRLKRNLSNCGSLKLLLNGLTRCRIRNFPSSKPCGTTNGSVILTTGSISG